MTEKQIIVFIIVALSMLVLLFSGCASKQHAAGTVGICVEKSSGEWCFNQSRISDVTFTSEWCEKTKDECYSDAVLFLHNTSICEQISNKSLKDECINFGNVIQIPQ
jgi:hypothetical protein